MSTEAQKKTCTVHVIEKDPRVTRIEGVKVTGAEPRVITVKVKGFRVISNGERKSVRVFEPIKKRTKD